MIKKTAHLKNQTQFQSLEYKPLFFNLKDTSDKFNLGKLIKENINITIYDEIYGQIEELIKSINPKTKYNKTELSQAAKDYIGDASSDEYGIWVYYPWSSRLVHILDEEEFILVRTSRNQYKITPEERDVLSKQKIGVIGLSVGQSISLTMALERIFGEIRIADFDILELSNLNRIRSGLHNLGILKTVSVAREILEIDPFLKVVCYHDGITEENINDFFLKGGKLDLVIDECDGLDVKILCRYKAKELKIPVFMESSDRGTIDIERFDLEPDRSILHGLIDHLDHTKLKYLKTNEEKIPFILPMLGTDTISTRMKASMVEIEKTITTWPQLASAVTFGGGVGTDVCRRIILDQFHESGRYIIDMEDLIGDIKEKKTYKSILPEITALTIEEMKSMAKELLSSDFKNKIVLDNDKIKKIVNSAIQAPSIGNNQPWKWLYENGNLLLFHDKIRSVSFGDYNEIGSDVALGACIENLILKSHQLGLNVQYELFPHKNKTLIARFQFSNIETINTKDQSIDSLVDFIDIRCTNRKCEIRTPISQKDIDALKRVAQTINGANLFIINTEKELEKIKNIIGPADRLRFMHPQGHHDFYHNEIKWTKEEVERTRDGLDINAFDLSLSEKTGLKIASDPEVIKYLNLWHKGEAFEKISRKAVDSASAIGFLTMPEYNRNNYLDGGRAMQRIWLEATKINLAIHPLLAPLFLFTRLTHGKGKDMPENMCKELISLRKDFIKIFPVNDNIGEIFLFKIAKGKVPEIKSLRRSVETVLTFSN
jgi:tRNA A37 threonylcarbamoyladenosine dehydratase